MEVIECTKGHYDVQEVPFGTVYRWWCLERVVVECDCGQRTTLTRMESVCSRCGADHGAIVRQEVADHRVGEETTHPSRYGEVR